MGSQVAGDDLWRYAETFLPPDIESLGRENGIVRLREFGSVSSLLRVMLAWAQPGSSFQTSSAWAKASKIAEVSPEALFYRVSRSESFLEAVLGRMLSVWREIPGERRLLVVDATVLTGPASRGTDWRVHMLYDPCRAVPCGLRVSTSKQGETFSLHDLRTGDLVLGDRGYGHFRGFVSALAKGADVLVRVEPGQMRVFDRGGKRVCWKALAEEVPPVGSADFERVWQGPDGDCRKVRIVGTRTSRNDVCWLATNVPAGQLSNAQAADLYRVRWQVELLFKRMKSLLEMNDLRSREGPTAKAYLYAKLITAFLALRLSDEPEAFSPYGYDIRNVPTNEEPLERVQAGSGRPGRRDSRLRHVDAKGRIPISA